MSELEKDPRWELVFEEAQRALVFQQGIVDNLRSRAVVLTAAATFAGTVLGVPALKSGQFSFASIFAIGAGALVVILTVVICAPWYSWSFTANTRELAQAVKLDYDINEIYENLAADFEGWIDRNSAGVRALQQMFIAALLMLFIEILCWWLAVLQMQVVANP